MSCNIRRRVFLAIVFTSCLTFLYQLSANAIPDTGDISRIELTKNVDGFRLVAKDVTLRALADKISAVTGVEISMDEELGDQIISVDENHADLESLIKSISDSNAIVYENQKGKISLVSAIVTSRKATEDSPQAEPEEELSSQPEKGVPYNESARQYILTNSRRTLRELRQDDAKAVLFSGAIFDTQAFVEDGHGLDIPDNFKADPDTLTYIVQFDRKIGSSDRNAIEALGAVVSHYIPNRAYAVMVNQDGQLDALRKIPGVYVVAPYHPYFKMSQVVRDRLVSSEPLPENSSPASFKVMTFADADIDAELAAIGVTVNSVSSDGHRQVVKIEADREQVTQVLFIDGVQWVEPFTPATAMVDLGRRTLQIPTVQHAHPTLDGDGVTVAITDTGIDFEHQAFSKIPGPTSLDMNSRIAYYEARPGPVTEGLPGDIDGHGTHVAGTVLGNGALSSTVNSSPGSEGPPYSTNQFSGMAPGAKVVMLEDFNSFSSEEQAEIGYQQGARIANNSWGYPAFYEYGTDSALWDALVRDADSTADGNQEYIVFFAAGNEGDAEADGTGGSANTVTMPANAKNVITMGAIEQSRYANNIMGIFIGGNQYFADIESDSSWQVASYSSRGPVSATDLRIKPDLVAPGSYVLSAQSQDTTPDELITESDLSRTDYRFGNVDTGSNYAYFSGTSMASPHGAGAAALVYQHLNDVLDNPPSPALMKAILVAGARSVHSIIYRHPTYDDDLTQVDEGWGAIDVARSIDGPRIRPTDEVFVYDQADTDPLETDESYSETITIGANEGGLKVVLAYTDEPGTPGAGIQLVNNLDLIVFGPNGAIYRGNEFDIDGVHALRFNGSDTVRYDQYNNVESITIPGGVGGNYTIRVYGRQVPVGPQDFALVMHKGVGSQGRTAGNFPSIALDTNGYPVVAYSHDYSIEGLNSNLTRQIFVKRWRGRFGEFSDLGRWSRLENQWNGIRDSLSENGISHTVENSEYPSIAIGGENIYVAWEEGIQAQGTTITNQRVFLKYYNGDNWLELGNSAQGFGVSKNTNGYDATLPVVAVMGNGQPVVAWLQEGFNPNLSRVFVATWNGTNWVGFADSHINGVPTPAGTKLAESLSIAINSAGLPVLAFKEVTNPDGIVVLQWTGAAWGNISPPDSPPYLEKPRIASADGGNNLALSWIQTYGSNPGQYSSYQVYAMRYNGAWSAVGGSTTFPGISAAKPADRPLSADIGIGYDNALTVAWQGGTNIGERAVFSKKWFIGDTNWVGIFNSDGLRGITRENEGYSSPDVVIDPAGLPIVTFANTLTASDDQEVQTYTPTADRLPPSFDGIRTATGGTNGDVRLTWNLASDDLVAQTNIRYNIYMGTNAYPCFDVPICSPDDVFSNLIATVTNATSFTVTNLAAYELRCFGVRAVDTSGNEDSNFSIEYANPIEAGVECFDRDLDGDGLPDWWEFTWFGNITNASPDTTNVVGGLNNLDAYTYGTDPLNIDSDGDGLTDLDEITTYETFPTTADTDADGLDDNVEIDGGSDPLNADSNGNGVSDGDMICLGYSFAEVTMPTALYTNLYVETFEADSPSRNDWTKDTPNQAYPLNFWHLSTATPTPGVPGVIRINDRSTNTSYRMAIDISKSNPDATYNAGTNRWIAGLISPVVDATSVDNLFVSWKEFYDLEANKDFAEVQVRSETDTNIWTVVRAPSTGSSGDWVNRSANLSAFAGQSNIQIRLMFLADPINNAHHGWYVDDVKFYAGEVVGTGSGTYELPNLGYNSWLRDIDGCPVVAGAVYAIGVGTITNTVGGHKIVQPGKVFGTVYSDNKGSFSFRGLARGKYIFKAVHGSYREEFWNGDLYTPPYSFGSGVNPGVFMIDDITGGILDLTAGGPEDIHFELEPGESAGLLAASAPVAEDVAVNYYSPLSVWNGSTSSPSTVAYTALPDLSVVFNQADWYTTEVQPNFVVSLAAGSHRVGLDDTHWNIGSAAVDVRAGEYSRVGISTNAGEGFVYVAALDGEVRDIFINGADSGSDTPSLLKVAAGQHLVQLGTASQALNLSKWVDVPLGGRTNIAFTISELNGETGSLVLQTFDREGNEVNGADIYINGRLLSTNSMPYLSADKTPATVGDLVAGYYNVSFRKDGYKQTPFQSIGVLADESSYVYGVLYEDDVEFDNVGDATEIDAFTDIFSQSGIDDFDADGLSNQQEFDFKRDYGIYLDPADSDTDNDSMLDGEEIGFDGYLTAGDQLLYAYTTLSTNAVEDSDELRLRFEGRYLDGIWNFGSGTTARVSVNGDIVESPTFQHIMLTTPTNACVETVITGVPSGIVAKAISSGAPLNTRVFADTDPSSVDTDADDMWDGFENSHQFFTNAFLQISRILDPIGKNNGDSDPDGDGLINKLEFLGPNGVADITDSTSPSDGDTDKDTMPDGWEYEHGLDPNSELDASEDPDTDFLPNDMEYQYGSNPNLFDSDADGIGDGEEVIIYGTDPTKADSDYDGLFDGLEIILGTDPAKPDTDGDGMTDGFEVLDIYGNLRDPGLRLNPLDPSDADDDYDGDGLSNLEEYLVRDGRVGNPSVLWDYWSDPFNADTDGDTMPDGWEVYYGLHPVDPVIDTLGATATRYSDLSVSGDKDGDGLWNLREYAIRFYLDPNADTNAIFGNSTDPNDTDTDDDGLGDGEEDRVFRSNPLLQDSDGDRLFDGAGQDPRWGEIESTFKKSHYLLVSCPTCTWKSAEAMAQVPHPDYPEIIGHLATISVGQSDDILELTTEILTGTEEFVAIGGTSSNGPNTAWRWLDNGAFLELVDTANYIDDEPNYLAIDTNFVTSFTWTTIVSTQTLTHYLVEWDEVPVVTNHYDMALNDLWRLSWPSASPLPFWSKIEVDEESPLPPPRWASAATYNPVFETKNPRNDIIEDNPTKILLDNRQLIVIGGTDGTTKLRDVWEYNIRSNFWTLSTAPLDALLPGYSDGMSEAQAVTVFIDKKTGCESDWNDSEDFGNPKSRPWSNSRSFDWTYLFGGWTKGYAYTENHAFYKSTDDPRPIEESTGLDVGLSEYIKTNSVPPDVLQAEDTDGHFLIGFGEPVDNNVLREFSAIQINNFNFKAGCDYIVSAYLNLQIDFNSAGTFDIDVYAEIDSGLGHSDPEYNSDIDIQEPSTRLGSSIVYGPVTVTVPAGTGELVVDVSGLVSNIVHDSGVWDNTVLGFVIENDAASGFARVDTEESNISITYIPSYKIEPYWDYPTLISTTYSTENLTDRKSVAMAFDHTRQRLLQFGGMNGNRVFGATYEGELTFTGGGDPKTVFWVEQSTSENPPARWGASMVFDEKNARFVLFGGFDEAHRPLNDLWMFYPETTEEVTSTNENSEIVVSNVIIDAVGWVEVTEFDDLQVPMPRGGASMIYYGGYDYDRAIDGYSAAVNQQKVVMFGGTDGKTYFNDTWVLDDGTASRPPRWILASPVGEQSQGPGPRAFANFVHTQNGGVSPDPTGSGTYEATESIPPASSASILFGGRTGVIPTGEDTDMDMVNDGVEHAIGGPASRRDPRLNALVNPVFITVTNLVGTNLVEEVITTESIPFALKRIGSKPSSDLFLRGAVANLESLRHDDGIFAIGMGMPWEEHVDPYSRVSVTGGDPQPGVDAVLVDHTDLWYHRYADGDPNDPLDVWELGVPDNSVGSSIAPPYAHSGRWVYGTKLDSNYPDDAVIDLFSPKFDLSVPSLDSTDTNNLNSFFLVFEEWLDLADANDYVQVDVIRPTTLADVATRVTGTNKTDLVVLGARNSTFNTTGDWRRVAVPLNITGNETDLFLRFRLWSDAAGNAGGWYIDDIAIMQGGEVSGVLSNFGAGFTVNLHGAGDGSIIAEAITSSDGEFGFGLLPQGDYYASSLSSNSLPFTIGSGSWGGVVVLTPGEIGFSLVTYSLVTNTIFWEAIIGQEYQVQYADAAFGPWVDLGSSVVAATNPESIVDPGPIPGMRFYRVKLLNQP